MSSVLPSYFFFLYNSTHSLRSCFAARYLSISFTRWRCYRFSVTCVEGVTWLVFYELPCVGVVECCRVLLGGALTVWWIGWVTGVLHVLVVMCWVSEVCVACVSWMCVVVGWVSDWCVASWCYAGVGDLNSSGRGAACRYILLPALGSNIYLSFPSFLHVLLPFPFILFFIPLPVLSYLT